MRTASCGFMMSDVIYSAVPGVASDGLFKMILMPADTLHPLFSGHFPYLLALGDAPGSSCMALSCSLKGFLLARLASRDQDVHERVAHCL